MKNEIQIITPQFERTWELDYNFIPQSDEEFYSVIEKAPLETLIGMGFGKWDKYNKQVEENKNRPVSEVIEIECLNSDTPIKFDIGRKDAPVTALEKDKWILLFPAEWYNHIPEGFKTYGLSGDEREFKKGVSDDDTRFGCLAYGILKD